MLSTVYTSTLCACQRNAKSVPKYHWIFNQVGAPVVLASQGERGYSIDNVSNKRVNSYQLGCVSRDGGGVKIRQMMEERRVDWMAGEGEQIMTTGQLEVKGICRKMGSLVAVVMVSFADHTKWQFPVAKTFERPNSP